MGFSASKALVYGLALFGGLVLGLTIAGDRWGWPMTLGVAAIGGVIGGAIFGYMMRETTMEVAGATLVTVDAALAASLGLRGFRRQDVGEGAIYTRGFGIMGGDRFTATPTATGVTLKGPHNIIRLVKAKAAG